MSSKKPHNDVQQELEGLSPLLARLRDGQKATESSDATGIDTLHDIGRIALDTVPIEAPEASLTAPSGMRVVHRRQKWATPIAAAVALLIGALISYSILAPPATSDVDIASFNAALSEELIASYEAQTDDPIAFLLDDEMLFAEEDDLFFSPAEDVLLDWADDGNVDEALSEEVMIDALW
ncbi:MAG: hypothetical protein AB8F78_15255 [Saprospiraceae bacterium]